MKKNNKQFINSFTTDYNNIVEELYKKNMIRESKMHAINDYGDIVEITRENRTNESNIMYDKQISIDDVMNTLLEKKEYNMLLYDRSIIQYEFYVENGKIKKERLIFIKKHNYLWKKEEINLKEAEDIEVDWFQEEKGIPTVIRIDYDKDSYEEIAHPITHMTLSNYDECRIPMMGSVSLYNFVNFVLNFFYNDSLNFKSKFEETDITISNSEKQRVHFEWQ